MQAPESRPAGIGTGIVTMGSSRLKCKVAAKTRFQFELLEPRHLFSVTAPGSAPPVDPSSYNVPSAEQLVDEPLTSYLWLPMVFVGADRTVSVSSSLTLAGDVIVNGNVNLTLAWSKLSGPGNAAFGNASSASTSVQFDQAGTYELQLTATNAGLTAFDRVFVTVTASNVINIDQGWLNARGSGPYYLDQQGKTYVLQQDVTTSGTAFAIIAKDVTFDLNGHTITYDNAPRIVMPNGSFEVGTGGIASGWNFSRAPSAARHQGLWLKNETYEGDYSLKFALPTGNQYVTSTQTITLEANTTYSLSAMFEYGGAGDTENPGVKGYVRLTGNGLTTREVYWNSTNWRGIQLREGTFTTGNTQETYSIQVGVEGGGALNPATAKPFYIDDIKIQRTNVYGVTASAKDWAAAYYPGLSKWGTGTNAVIKNGSLVQGVDGATRAHGVFIHTVDGVTVQNLAVTVHGANTSTLFGLDQGTFTSRVLGNTLTSNVKTISTRDNFDGAVIYGLQGEIGNNTITNGVHTGIYVPGGTAQNRVSSNVYGNAIQLSSRYTNGFGIIAGYGSQIHHNTINSGSGTFGARGILASGELGLSLTKVFSNVIHVQERGSNQEYEGATLGGAYGIQLENAKNVEVYGNDVYAYGRTVPAYAFRMNSDGGTTSDVYVHDNNFNAIASGAHAATLKFSKIDAGTVRFEDNRLNSNDGIVGATNDSYVDLLRSTLSIDAPITDAYPIESEYADGTGLHTRIRFIDTVFADAAARAYLDGAKGRAGARYGGALDARIAFDVAWTTAFRLLNFGGAVVSGATVTVKNSLNGTIASGGTDANGRFVAVINQFTTQGGNKSSSNPMTVLGVASSVQVQQQFSADRTQTIDVPFSGTEQGTLLDEVAPAENASNVLERDAEPIETPQPDDKGTDDKATEKESANHVSRPVAQPTQPVATGGAGIEVRRDRPNARTSLERLAAVDLQYESMGSGLLQSCLDHPWG